MNPNQLKTKVGKNRNDRGAVLIWFSVLAVAMIGMGSLVVDVGALWSERRQLQNGADAAALAVAIDCSRVNCATTKQSMAQQYANFNSEDNKSTVMTVCGKGPGLDLVDCITPPASVGSANWVHVKLKTLEGAGDEINYALAPVLDSDNKGKTVTASATAAWGTISGAKVLALVIGRCAFNPAWISADGSTNFPANQVLEISLNSDTFCVPNFPQGFDFLNQNAGPCLTEISQLGSQFVIYKENQGNSPVCTGVLEGLISSGTPFQVPIAITKVKGPPDYYVVNGIATVILCGADLPSLSKKIDNCPTQGGGPGCKAKGNVDLICGRFVARAITEGDIGGPLGDPGTGDYGTRVIKMVG